MTNWTIDKVRETFLNYFKDKGHTEVASSPLLPAGDKTLLFTNAGMNQFKNLFLGTEKRSYTRACSSQKCVRAGGKHNDLENVGFTTRHHTFFEMLGNFSFGDYFKEDAIKYAWELVTEVYKLDKNRLFVTVFRDDDEAEKIWIEKAGVDPKRIFRLGEKDNFWSMGDTGPCGPCSEIHYDLGKEFKVAKPFLDNGMPDFDCGRFVEIWNLVFMQFNRDETGKMTPLPNPSIDTGMGLERTTAILNGKLSNYDIDIFQDLISFTRSICPVAITEDLKPSLNVIADHARAASFLIADSITPSNEGRGYVLRRIMRRAIRHGHKLGFSDLFFDKVCNKLIGLMGTHYTELKVKSELILNIVKEEEKRFRATLEKGLALLEDGIKSAKSENKDKLSGELVFKLYDTYGFPPDLTGTILEEKGFSYDEAGFDKAMNEQKARGKASWCADLGSERLTAVCGLSANGIKEPVFAGYEKDEADGSIVALFNEKFEPVSEIFSDECFAVLDPVVFYAESGGQMADHGILQKNGETAAEVVDCIKVNEFRIVRLKIVTPLKTGELVFQKNDMPRRSAIRKNHSATHLLHHALKSVLGSHVNQAGSLVGPERLRFDFNHYQAVTKEQIKMIETEVNFMIGKNSAVNTVIKSIEQAKKDGATALFGEKYGETVRVVTMGSSKELCGGTHVSSTGEIGLFKIIKEEGIAAGVRRIEAVTSLGAFELFREYDDTISELASMLNTEKSMVVKTALKLADNLRSVSAELRQVSEKLASMQAEKIEPLLIRDGTKIFVIETKKNRADALTFVDSLKSKYDNALIVVTGEDSGKALVIVGVTGAAKDKFHAGNMLKSLLEPFGGKGGGKPDMAQGGAPSVDFEKLKELVVKPVS
ncbi:MAG TPA: alanine--tRNA ligase [bacterium]|nr:alanine--tRNA ligase [bacterium]